MIIIMEMASKMSCITYPIDNYIFLINPVNLNLQTNFTTRYEISYLHQYFTYIEMQIIDKWLTEKEALFAKLYDKEGNSIICFALIHKLDFDPYNKHKRPSYIDFIFTIPEFRRSGAALELLKQLRNVKLELTASVNIPESLKLFNKAGYKSSGKSNGCLMLQS